MSIASRQVKRVLDSIIEDFIKSGTYPGFPEVRARFVQAIKGMLVGQPIFKPHFITPKAVFDIGAFNQNLNDLVEDEDVLYEEQLGQITRVLRHHNSAEMEYQKLDAELRRLIAIIQGLLLYRRKNDTCPCFLGDSFSDLTEIDSRLSTVEIDTVEGVCRLPANTKAIRKLDTSHLWFEPVGNFKITQGNNQISRQLLTPESSFGNAFRDVNKVWKQHIFTGEPTRLVGDFSFSVARNHRPVALNRISIIVHARTPIIVGVHYKSNITTQWLPLPSKNPIKRIKHAHTWNFDPAEIEGDGITDLRFTFTKQTPDAEVDGEFLYEIGVRNISMYITSNDYAAELYSKSIEAIDLNGDLLTINQVALEVEQDVPTGCKIDHYIAMDQRLPIGMVDSSGTIVSIDHPAATEFSSGVAHDGILESELRDWAIRSETDTFYDNVNYRYWEPYWHHIQPLEHLAQPDASGDLGSYLVKFDQLASMNQDIINNSWTAGTPNDILSIKYYDIFRFPNDTALNDTILLWQGKHSWVKSSEVEDIIVQTEASGIIQDASNGFPADPLLVAPGNVVQDSITNVRAAQDSLRREPYRGEGLHPEYLTKVDGANLWLARNDYTTGDQIPYNQVVTFNYSYRKIVPSESWVTNVYIEPREVVKMKMPLGFRKAYISNRDVNTDFEVGFSEVLKTNATINLSEVGQGFGWYQVTLEVDDGASYYPTHTDPFPSGALYYASREPLRLISEYALNNSTHYSDHTSFAIRENQDVNGFTVQTIVVNDPTEPSGDITYSSQLLSPGRSLDAVTIFETAASVNTFYDLSYDFMTSDVNNILYRARFSSDTDSKTPTLSKYIVRIGNEIRTV